LCNRTPDCPFVGLAIGGMIVWYEVEMVSEVQNLSGIAWWCRDSFWDEELPLLWAIDSVCSAAALAADLSRPDRTEIVPK
jgi:hypothetical protein